MEENLTLIWIRNKLEDWVNNSYSQETMISWLKGYELPPVGHEEEPFVWIFHSASELDNTTLKRLVVFILRFLEEINWEKGLSEKHQDKIFYNLFCLCSSLHYPDLIGKALWDIFELFDNKKGNPNLFVSKKYNLIGAFRGALISNQYNAKYKPIWEKMLGGKNHHFLGGNEYIGFEGILNINKSIEEYSQPDVDEIGWALGEIIHYLEFNEEVEQCKKNFRYLLTRIKQTWANFTFWDAELIKQANKWKYPLWAVLCFDTLVIELSKYSSDKQHFYIWNFFVPYIRNYAENQSSLFSPLPITEVALNSDDVRMLNFIKTRIDLKRLDCDLNLNHDVITQICDADLTYMIQDWNNNLKEHFLNEKDIFIKELTRRRIKKIASFASKNKKVESSLLSIAKSMNAI